MPVLSTPVLFNLCGPKSRSPRMGGVNPVRGVHGPRLFSLYRLIYYGQTLVKYRLALSEVIYICGCTGLKTQFLWKWIFEKNTFNVFLDTNSLERVYSGVNLQSELQSEHLHHHWIFP